jgi:hypothetical protein
MAYVGRSPRYGFLEGQTATFNGSTTVVTLQRNVSSTDAIDVFIDNVHQEPDVAYTLSSGGNSITFTGTPDNGAVLYIRFHGIAFDTARAYRLVNSDEGSSLTLGNDDTLTLSLDGTTALTATSSGITIPNLTVTGTTTSVNSTNLEIGDNKITLNSDVASDAAPTENAGIVINRGSSADVQFLWNETNDEWYAGNDLATGGIFRVKGGGTTPTLSGSTLAAFTRSAATNNASIAIIGNSGGFSSVHFGDENDEDVGQLNYSHTADTFALNKGLGVTGNITVSGTVDGVDIATRDGILTSTTTTAGAALPKAGGTMTGNLEIRNASQNFGDEATIRGSTSTGNPKAEIAFKRESSGNDTSIVFRSSNDGTLNASAMILDASARVSINASGHYDTTTKLTVGGRINTTDGTVTGSMNYGNGTLVNIGSLSNHPVQLMTNNSTIMTLATNGDVNLDNGALKVGGTTVIDSSRVGTLTGLSVATPSLSTDEALYIQNNPATAASNTARIRLAQSSNDAGTVLKLEHNRSNPTGSKMIDATVNHVGTPYNVFSVHGQGRTTVGSYAAANPNGTAINDAQLNVFHPTALGTSTGDDLKLLQVSGHSGNQSALTIRQRRMSDGNTWISDGFSITQDVDNTEAVYTYMYLHDGNVETDNNLGVKGVPSAPLHVHGGGSNPSVIVESGTTTGAWVAMRTGQTSGEHFKVGTNATGFHVYNETDAATRLHISKSGGNVGIGNTDTDYKLSVGDTTTYNYLEIQGANSNVMGGIRFKHHGGGSRTGVAKEWIISRGSDQTQFNAGVSSSVGVGGLVFWAAETGATTVDAMRLKDDGNAIFGYKVGINNTNPSYTLQVGNSSQANMGVGWARHEYFTVGIHGSITRWYKLANYAVTALQGQLFMNSARNGGANQTNGARIQHGSLAGYNGNINSGDWGDLGTNYGHNNYYVFVGSDSNIYLRVGASIYGGEVYCQFVGRANWVFDGTFVTSEP